MTRKGSRVIGLCGKSQVVGGGGSEKQRGDVMHPFVVQSPRDLCRPQISHHEKACMPPIAISSVLSMLSTIHPWLEFPHSGPTFSRAYLFLLLLLRQLAKPQFPCRATPTIGASSDESLVPNSGFSQRKILAFRCSGPTNSE